MLVSQRDVYALQAVFELATRYGLGPVKVSDVAAIQAIPPKFLEVILNQLKQAGFVASRRGQQGGYVLLRSPDELTIGDVMRFLRGPTILLRVDMDGHAGEPQPGEGTALRPVWRQVQKAIWDIYDSTTFQNLIEADTQKAGILTYAI